MHARRYLRRVLLGNERVLFSVAEGRVDCGENCDTSHTFLLAFKAILIGILCGLSGAVYTRTFYILQGFYKSPAGAGKHIRRQL